MKGDPVSFTVEHDRPKAVGTDLMNGLKHLATVGRNRLDRLREASLGVEIDERAGFRR